MTARHRLDLLLVERGAFPSRARAQAAIKAGLVRIGGKVLDKPSAEVAADAQLEVSGDVHDYVSRGALKLEAALRAFKIDPSGRICLDLGASTGGFTEALLRRGAAKVYAVDVGFGQLHERIARDSRVVSLEKTHAKDLTRALVPESVDVIVCDVSFISLKKALPFAMALAAPNARLIALVKPQFELGPEKIGKGGRARASDAELDTLTRTLGEWLKGEGWPPAGVIESPIEGGDGNREFLIGAIKSA
ncbi:MAG: TlyA family RNA methyltransferase [Parvularculaceae bacterium]|nr:TlyA family RNA methyltransferase [Parvularculaceae bacterium]